MRRLIFLLASSLAAQTSMTITVQETTWAGMTGADRTNDPITVSIPLKDEADQITASNVRVSGASAVQATCLGTWPSGRCKWLQIDHQISLSTPGTTTFTVDNAGSGTTTGTLATDNGATITVSTGTATYVIKKANHNGFETVTVGSTSIVSSGSRGWSVMGPAYPTTSCTVDAEATFDCTTEYATRYDDDSTCEIELNGPLRAIVKCTGGMKDESGNLYLRLTARYTFWKNKTAAHTKVALQNAEYSGNDVRFMDSYKAAWKGYSQFGLGLNTSELGSTRSFAFAQKSGGTTSGSFSGSEDVYLYAGHNLYGYRQGSNHADGFDSGTSVDCFGYASSQGTKNACSVSQIYRRSDHASGAWYSSVSSPFHYAQQGYRTIQGTTVLDSGTSAASDELLQGWGDLKDSGGAGIMGAKLFFSQGWPAAIEMRDGGDEFYLAVKPSQTIWPDSECTTATPVLEREIPCKRGYYIAYPQYEYAELWVVPHSSAVTAWDEARKMHHPLIGRATVDDYNDAGVFPYKILDPAVEDAYYNALGASASPTMPVSRYCNGTEICLSDSNQPLFYWKDMGWAGPAGNQQDHRWGKILQFLQRGYVARYQLARGFYNWMMEVSLPRSDGFQWRDVPISNVLGQQLIKSWGQMNWTMPNMMDPYVAKHPTANYNGMDDEHAHWYGLTDYYFLTGDGFARDYMVDDIGDRFLRADLPLNDGKYLNERALGAFLAGEARLYKFLNSVGESALADLIPPIVDHVLEEQVFPDLVTCLSCGNSFDINDQGVDKTRGAPYVFRSGSITWFNPPATLELSPKAQAGLTRGSSAFTTSIFTEGITEFLDAVGPTWGYYWKLKDYALGVNQFIWTEMYMFGGTYQNSWHRYVNSLDWPNCPAADSIYYTYYTDAGAPGCDPKGYFIAHAANNTNFHHWVAHHKLTGDILSLKTYWEYYLLALWWSQGNQFAVYDNATFMWWDVIWRIQNPHTEPLLIDVSVSVTPNGGGSYTLNWTPPNNVQSYHLHYREDGKAIVDNLNFDPAVNIYGIDPATNAPWWSSTHHATPPAQGDNSITVTGLATSGVSFGLKAYVTQTGEGGDATPPSVSITEPVNGATVSGVIPVTASASDTSGISNLIVRRDGATCSVGVALGSACLNTGTCTYSLNTAALPNGTHTLCAIATDAAGNAGTSPTISVTVDNETPPPPSGARERFRHGKFRRTVAR